MANFIVYNVMRYEIVSRHETERGAKIACTRYQKKTKDLLAVMTPAEIPNVPMKTVISLMTGKEVQIPVNTPRACDPSTELYCSI